MWTDILITAIGSGSVTGLLTWLFSKRKRNNDFIAELQGSIDILSKNYTETLNRLVEVQRQNVELLTNQDALTREVEKLNKEIEKLKKENTSLICKINELNKLFKSKANEKADTAGDAGTHV